MLKISDLSVAYGGLHALAGVNLAVDAGRFVSVVGPNGAGKTTRFKAISGAVPLESRDLTYGLFPRLADRERQLAGTLSGGEQQLCVLLVEQRVAEALEACDYGYVLESGKVPLEGSHLDLMKDPKVKQAYLGM